MPIKRQVHHSKRLSVNSILKRTSSLQQEEVDNQSSQKRDQSSRDIQRINRPY